MAVCAQGVDLIPPSAPWTPPELHRPGLGGVGPWRIRKHARLLQNWSVRLHACRPACDVHREGLLFPSFWKETGETAQVLAKEEIIVIEMISAKRILFLKGWLLQFFALCFLL
jgi:hypothetical protein